MYEMFLSILHDLAKQPFTCPRLLTRQTKKEFDELYLQIIKHKMGAFIYHLTTCKNCKKKFSKSQLKKLENYRISKLLASKELRREIAQIDKLLAKNKIKALLPKELSWLKTYNKTPLFQSSSDIDLLVSKNDFLRIREVFEKSGWEYQRNFEEFSRILRYRWQDLNYSKKGRLNVDIQYNVGRLHNTPDRLIRAVILDKIVEDFLKKYKGKGVFRPAREIQFVLAIIHFYFFDKLYGIRQAFEIKEMALELGEKEWRNSVSISKEYKVSKILWFVLLTLEKYFDVKIIPDYLSGQIKPAIHLASKLFPFIHTQNPIKKEKIGLYIKLRRLPMQFLMFTATYE